MLLPSRLNSWKNIFKFLSKDVILSRKITFDFFPVFNRWDNIIALEEIITELDISVKELPRVLKGKGYGIIDDCGGVPGLERIAEAFDKKEDQEYKQYCEWLGTNELDLKTFDVDKMNLALKDSITELIDFYEGD